MTEESSIICGLGPEFEQTPACAFANISETPNIGDLWALGESNRIRGSLGRSGCGQGGLSVPTSDLDGMERWKTLL